MNVIIWIITSSVLILAVIAARAAFGKKLSAGLRYALWGLVLLRLLIPGTLFSFPVSIENAAEQTEAVRDFELLQGVEAIAHTETGSIAAMSLESASRTEAEPIPMNMPEAEPADMPEPVPEEPQIAATLVENATPERFFRMQTRLKLRDIFKYVWLIGSGVCLIVFAVLNIRFCADLRSRRKRLDIECRLPVYSVKRLSSSCLFLGTVYNFRRDRRGSRSAQIRAGA